MEWNSVAMTVPEEKSFVLISMDGAYVDIALYRNGRFILSQGKEVRPDAWVKLPRPYRVGKHEIGFHERTARAQRLAKYGIIK